MVRIDQTGRRLSDLCEFDAETLACSRCGYVAKKLPYFRHCQTLLENAEAIAHGMATKRIKVPPLLIGKAIGNTLARVGITPLAVKKITGKDCGCKERASKMDAAGAAVSAVVERAANAALQVVLPSHVAPEDIAAIANTLYASPLTNAGLKAAAENKIDH
jgi:hypothetical protein